MAIKLFIKSLLFGTLFSMTLGCTKNKVENFITIEPNTAGKIKILKEYHQHNIVLQAVGEISGIVKIRIGNKGNNTNNNPNGSRPPVNYTLGPGKVDTIVTFTETYNDEIFIYYSSLNSPKGLLKLGISGTADIIPRKGNTGISKIEFCP